MNQQKSANSQAKTVNQREFLEEKKEFSKIHKANLCMFFLYLFIYGFLVLMVIAWAITPDMPKSLEGEDNTMELSDLMKSMLQSFQNMSKYENKEREGLS
ncbi:UNKNOWN [Stylonychia lemnae]|uniref:Uncharacterized protein n=1 Tax=Stylonychia lemnae TaxID=5949 RepID=A0A078AR74_STYLE|nr:UNKNOWN [Stylonychia lemnae]|eukprot:CDW84719.1 UNKNOWN [Stylonychia lemnae]